LLALAEVGFSVFFRDERFRSKAGPFVGTIAKGLIRGLTTGAKVILFSCFEVDGNGLVISYGWFVHKKMEFEVVTISLGNASVHSSQSVRRICVGHPRGDRRPERRVQ